LNLEVKNKVMNSKTKGLFVLSMIIVAAVAGALIYSMQSIVKADSTNSVASDAESTTAPLSVTTSDTGINSFCGELMAFGMQTRLGMGHRGELRGMGGFGNIQISSEFNQNVTTIAQSDTDVQNLLSQGYNITNIRPVISTTIDGNGNIVTKASTANILLQGDNGSRSFVVVDLSQAKVTKIVTLAITEIDK